ncbi:MAG TPA: GFA family protein [Steroidobacteraceae bacterium]|nr:GFA family protein [Steroidobacteraceae bacterium]
MQQEPIEGGCLCGAVRYRIHGAPRVSLICHCQSCRKAAGAPCVAWVTFAAQHLEWVRGQPRRHRSSPPVQRGFCESCGTPLTWSHERHADEIDITTASLDEPMRFPPTREVWLSERIGWQLANPALSAYPHGGS